MDPELNDELDDAQIDQQAYVAPEGGEDGSDAEIAIEGDEEGSGAEAASSEQQDAIAQAAQEAQVKGNSRAQERIRRQQEELRAARDRADAAERERQTLMQQLQQQQHAAEQFRQQQLLDTLDPQERQNYLLQQQLEQMRRDQMQAQQTMQDATDRLSFQQRALQNPMVAKYVDRVEETLATMRAKGQTAPREAILKFIIGEDVLAKAPAAMAKATKAPSRAAAKPIRARGDASSSGARDDMADLEERLSKQFL